MKNHLKRKLRERKNRQRNIRTSMNREKCGPRFAIDARSSGAAWSLKGRDASALVIPWKWTNENTLSKAPTSCTELRNVQLRIRITEDGTKYGAVVPKAVVDQ